MSDNPEQAAQTGPFRRPQGAWITVCVLICLGAAGFLSLLIRHHPGRAWQALLVNFLLWSAMAQGGLLFSIVMHLTKARWSRTLSGLSESFSAFFPVSVLVFFLLFIGREHIFPWLSQDLNGKEVWLNVPFLFFRGLAGLIVLYGLGIGYVINAMMSRWCAVSPAAPPGGMGSSLILIITRKWEKSGRDVHKYQKRMSRYGVLYAISYALVLSLLAYDLVMAADPHFVSTLFGAYSFVKAFYIGLAALIITASVMHIRQKDTSILTDAQFHDMGKLLLGFCLIWADFFYCQLVVIWYGNIPEETAYIIARTMISPWRELAWFVFIICFVFPFLVLLNRAVKSKPLLMSLLCMLIIMGMWLEHVLLLGPALFPMTVALPLGFSDGLVFVGFFGLFTVAVMVFISLFPESLLTQGPEKE